MAQLGKARALAVRGPLSGISMSGVRRDGTIDLSEPASNHARFVFISPRGEGPQPPRKLGTLPRRDYCGRQDIWLTHSGLFAEADQSRNNCDRERRDLPDPSCGPVELWKTAIKQGAPKNKVAIIEYYQAKAGPAWNFRINKTKYRFTTGADCQTRLSGDAATGRVPAARGRPKNKGRQPNGEEAEADDDVEGGSEPSGSAGGEAHAEQP
jgi:hypothetical protein